MLANRPVRLMSLLTPIVVDLVWNLESAPTISSTVALIVGFGHIISAVDLVNVVLDGSAVLWRLPARHPGLLRR